MNNSTEFTDETKPLAPEVLNKINSTGGDGSDSNTGKIRDQNETVNLTDVDNKPDLFESVDFTSYKSIVTNAKYFSRLQDVSNIVLNGFRVPFCSGDFRPLTIPLSRNRVPVIPEYIYLSANGITGSGSTNVNWISANEEAYFDDYILDENKFAVKMDEKTKSKLMTLVSIWSNEYLDKGVRDSRARPSAVLGDWAYALPPTFSMTERYIRTDVIATWMYGSYTATSPAEKITIINNADLRAFMNADGGNYWPVEMNTLCLALGKASAATLTKLKITGHNVIIDFDSSMNSSRGTVTTYNGVTAYEVSANSVSANDLDVAKILSNTFSSTDLQWAFFVNALPYSDDVLYPYATNHFDLVVYENSIPDQFINFYATHRDYGNKIPLSNVELKEFILAWRLYKTAFTQRTFVELGDIGTATSAQTYGKDITPQNEADMVSCLFSVKTGLFINRPMWIPYEMWIANGANLKLDGEDYVDGDSNVLVNCNYTVPRSQVLFNSQTDWSSTASYTRNADYYIPNLNVYSSRITITANANRICSCVPCTMPAYNSTSETQTIIWDKAQTIDFTYVRSGKNNNSIFRKKLVFTSAVKN